MKKCVYVMSLFFCLAGIDVAAMEKCKISKLEDSAWQQAFDGNRSQALKEFTKAAHAGSWQACRFLAHNYGQDPLLTDKKDDEKSQFFSTQADKVEGRSFLSEHDLKDQIKKLTSLTFAWRNSWYQQILDEINVENCSYFKQYPLPEDGILRFFSAMKKDISDSEKAQRRMQLFCQSIRSLQSVRLVGKVFEDLANEYHKPFNFSKDVKLNCALSHDLLMALEDVSPTLGLSEELNKAYDVLFSEYYHSYSCDRKNHIIIDSVIELFPHYVALDESSAVKALIDFLDVDLKSSWCGGIDRGFLKLLCLLPSQHLENYAKQGALKKSLVHFIEVSYKNPDLSERFNGTAFDSDVLARELLVNDNDTDFIDLIRFLDRADIQFYQKYETEISSALPSCLKKVPHKYCLLIPMAAKHDCPRLQTSAMESLVEYSSNPNENKYSEDIIKDLLDNVNFNEQEKKSLYQLMESVYQRTRYIKGLQFLWKHLADDETQRDFLESSILKYFCIEPVAVKSDKTCTCFSFFKRGLIRFLINLLGFLFSFKRRFVLLMKIKLFPVISLEKS